VADKKQGPSWFYRRILIFASYGLGAGMILFAVWIWTADTQTGVQLIIAGTSLVTLVTSAYIGAATVEDTKLWKEYGDDS
jgi:multisubunit Na+/H+ antiporter MnhG subunit